MTSGTGAASGARTRFPILLYHRIRAAGEPVDRFDVTLDAFREQMRLVASCGRKAQTVSELIGRRHSLAGDVVAVTFDDGTADFYHHAWPVLRAHGLPVTLYVTSALVDGRHEGAEMLSWQQLEELAAEGVEIGAHGHRHLPLDMLSIERAALELVNSRLALQDRLRRPVTSFAFPHGYHTAAVKQLLPRVGYRSACAVKNRLSHPHDDRYALSRMTVGTATSPERFEALLHGRGAAVAWDGERLRTRMWRAYRHTRARMPNEQ
ncbi:MAG TPA: polysaccharide deacetylase family protein [Conexibacter sp.]